MLKILATVIIVLFSSADRVSALDANELRGGWFVYWPNATKNKISLNYGDGKYSGTYVNDEKANCTITGNFSGPRSVILHIVCPKWDIRMEGAVTARNEVEGEYLAYGDSKGRFFMTRD